MAGVRLWETEGTNRRWCRFTSRAETARPNKDVKKRIKEAGGIIGWWNLNKYSRDLSSISPDEITYLTLHSISLLHNRQTADGRQEMWDGLS